MKDKIVIIGGGAAGMFAALIAQEQGAQVTILERNDRVGRKLLATGNGRCNYTNINASIENYYGANDKFAYSAFSQFDVYRTMDYFEGLGISPKVEANGKVFPSSLQSSSMIDVFRMEIRNRGIDLRLNSFVRKIYRMDNFKLELEGGEIISADKLIIATGGRSLGDTGSDGNGYGLAESLGHTTTETFPGIVQLHLEDKYSKEKSGVRINSLAELYIDGQFIKSDRDDILFTDYGISGPTILQLSRTAIEAWRQGKKVEIGVRVIGDRTEDELNDYLLRRFQTISERSLEEGLIGLINKKLIGPIIKTLGLDPRKKLAELGRDEVRSLAQILSCWKFKVRGHQPWEFAQVTAGGVATDQVDNRTMESKICRGLYFCGEVLDVDGDCGGYNLQWAWSSAYLAGLNAATS